MDKMIASTTEASPCAFNIEIGGRGGGGSRDPTHMESCGTDAVHSPLMQSSVHLPSEILPMARPALCKCREQVACVGSSAVRVRERTLPAVGKACSHLLVSSKATHTTPRDVAQQIF